MRMHVSLICLVLFASFAWSQDNKTAAQSAASARKSPTSGSVPIGPDDTINVAVLHGEELTRTWRVNSDGELRLPFIGVVKAAGMTVDQLEAHLAVRLRPYLNDPQVSVFMSESRSQPVTVMGAVGSPGTMQLQGRNTLLNVVNLAGGPKEGSHTLTLTREISNGMIPLEQARTTPDDKYSVAEIRLEDVLSGRGPAELEVLANDVIKVNLRPTRMVHVIGEVNRPGSIELATAETVSITKLVAAAGGFNRTAKPEKAVVRRIGSDNTGDTATLDLKKIIEGSAADLELAEGDVLIVPSSQFKQYLQAVSLTAVNAGVFSSLQVLARF